MSETKVKYRVEGGIEDSRVCRMAECYVLCWSSAFEDPRVFDGEVDATETLKVKVWENALEEAGYRMEYDAEEEGFWVIRIADGKAVDIFYY